MQASNAEEIQQIGRRVLTVSEALSLAGAVRPHSLSIVEAADKRDWTRVREELDRTQQTVRETMEKLRYEELSNLVSLGGWLRGTHVVAEFISESYSEDKAEILNQPGLIAHFRAFLQTIEGPAKTSPTILAISSTGRLTGANFLGSCVRTHPATAWRYVGRGGSQGAHIWKRPRGGGDLGSS